MIINFEGNEYEYDFDEIDVKQATTIFKKYGLTPLGMQQGLTDTNPDALRAVYWTMLAQNGETRSIDNLNFKVIKFGKALDAALMEEKRAEIEAKRDELEAKRDAGETLTESEEAFLAAIAKAGLAPLPKDQETD